MLLAQVTSTAVPLWLVSAGLIAFLALVLLVAYVMRMVVHKARAEDLPEVLSSMGEVLEATSGMLPWSRSRAGGESPEPPAGEPCTVITVNSVPMMAQTSHVPSPANLPTVADSEIER